MEEEAGGGRREEEDKAETGRTTIIQTITADLHPDQDFPTKRL